MKSQHLFNMIVYAKCSPKASTVGTLKTLPASDDADELFTATVGKVAGFPLHAGAPVTQSHRITTLGNTLIIRCLSLDQLLEKTAVFT